MPSSRVRTVVALGTAQTLAWASSYDLPAILAAPMAAEQGLSVPSVFAAFSAAISLAALVALLALRPVREAAPRGVAARDAQA